MEIIERASPILKDIVDAFHQIGVPTWVILVVFVCYAVAKEFRVLERPDAKSERELLSADQMTFRQALMDQVRALRDECGGLRSELAACETRHDVLAKQLSTILDNVKATGIEFLMSLSPAAPMDAGSSAKVIKP